MGIAGPGLLIIGLIVHLIGWIMLIVVAWRESIWWGLLSIFVPFVALIFVITHWQDAKRPFLISISGTAVFVPDDAKGEAGGREAGAGRRKACPLQLFRLRRSRSEAAARAAAAGGAGAAGLREGLRRHRHASLLSDGLRNAA